MVDVGHGEAQRVELAQLRVCRHPGQGQFQPLERLAQHAHSCPLTRVRCRAGDVLLRATRRSPLTHPDCGSDTGSGARRGGAATLARGSRQSELSTGRGKQCLRLILGSANHKKSTKNS